MLAFVEWQRNRMLDIETAYRQYRRPPELAPWWTPHAVKRFADSYLNYKIDNGCLDFTDMLALTWKEGLTLPVRVLVCDEFQDCTTLQNTLVLHWAMQCDAALMLGDCDQLIYGHLGAVPADFLDTPGDRHALGTNYRSGDTIVSFADRLIRRNQERVALPVHADHAGGLVQRLAALPRLDPERSTFVLARAHYLLNPIARLLEQRGTPFAMRRGSMGIPLNLHDKTFAAFRAVQALRSGRQVAPFSLHQLAQFVRGPYFTHGAKAAIQRMSAQDDGSGRLLIGLYDLPQFGGTPALIDAITHDRPDLLNRANPERIAYWRRVARTYGDAVLSTTPKIQLSTIHGVKGDEADDVYLLSDITPSVGEAMRATKRGMEAERRVFYVAATRARERLFVLPAQSGQQFEEVMPRRSVA
jgi:superfamily I DNA/RNA helicase